MELQRAISQISEIHAQMLRSEVFRGCRALPMAATSMVAMTAAVMQNTVLQPASLMDSLWFWVGYAVLCAGICGADLLMHCWVGDRRFRRQAAFVAAQFLPAVAVGVMLTTLLMPQPTTAPLLPGLWTMVFGLGIFSARSCPASGSWLGRGVLLGGRGFSRVVVGRQSRFTSVEHGCDFRRRTGCSGHDLAQQSGEVTRGAEEEGPFRQDQFESRQLRV